MSPAAGGGAPAVDDLLAVAPPGETPDLSGAHPRLGTDRVRMLSARGVRRPTSRGDLLIVEGRPDHGFVVVLAGRVAVVAAFGTPEQQIVRVHGPGRFLGELGLLTGQVAFSTAVALEAGEVLEVPRDRLRECLLRDAEFCDEILRASLLRRSLAIGEGHGFRIVGSRFSADTRALCEFAMRNRLPHRFVDLESDAGSESLLRTLSCAIPNSGASSSRTRRSTRAPPPRRCCAASSVRCTPRRSRRTCAPWSSTAPSTPTSPRHSSVCRSSRPGRRPSTTSPPPARARRPVRRRRFAERNPSSFRVMFADRGRHRDETARVADRWRTAVARLAGTGMRMTQTPEAAAVSVWSAVHGRLMLEGSAGRLWHLGDVHDFVEELTRSLGTVEGSGQSLATPDGGFAPAARPR